MGNFKIKVNTPEESNEVQYLFEVIGYERGACSLGSYPAVIVTTQDWATGSYCSTRALGLDIPAHENYKEATLQELRDMVVLKRNDVNDATHESGLFKYVELTDGWYYFEDKWLKSAGAKPEYYEKLKPIEKNMKEYLDKQEDGTYKLVTTSGGCTDRDWIEIPEGADYYAKDSNNGFNGEFFFRLRSDGFNYGAIYLEGKWMNAAFSVDGQDVLWKREKQPEELLFVDGENPSLKARYLEQAKKINDARDSVFKKQDDLLTAMLNHSSVSINEQYAEIEKVRQASKDNVNNPQHYNKGGVECINAIEASMTPEAFKGYLKGNVQKYMWRYEQKGGVESLRKAQWYLERLVASMDS